MNVTINRLLLKAALTQLSKLTPKYHFRPVTVVLDVDVAVDLAVTVVADRATTVTASLAMDCTDVDTPGRIAVPLKALRTELAKLSDTDVTLTADDDTLELTDGTVTTKLRLALLDDEIKPVTVDDGAKGQLLDTAKLRAVAHAASTDNARPVLCIVQLEQDGTAAATDSYRLASAVVTGQLEHVVQLDGQLARHVGAWKGEAYIVPPVTEEGTYRLSTVVTGGPAKAPRSFLLAVTVAGEHYGSFPQWRKLTPSPEQAAAHAVVTDVKPLVKRFRAVGKSASRNAPAVLTLDPLVGADLHVTCEESAWDERVDCTGAELTIAVNPTYFAAALEAAGTVVDVACADGLKPMMLRGDVADVLLMPMRVS